jgi:sporulation protein YlmC with PRC-barrel domain
MSMSADASMEGNSDENAAQAQDITTLIGREVYSSNGVFVGEIEDVRLDLDAERVSGIAIAALDDELFANVARGVRGVVVPYRWVRAVGDVVLVHDLIERPKDPEDEE